MSISATATTTFDSLWADLVDIGLNTKTGGYRRFAWTREDHTLREWFAAQCAEIGLDVVEDRAGNQWAWWGDPDTAPGVVVGSHLDSVPDGGAFDGPLGVVSALVAVRTLMASGVKPSVPVGVVNFVDEEGARFGVACAGSRIITGVLPADDARRLVDVDGVTMAEAWRAAGRDPNTLGPDSEALARVGSYVELHVEQGRALDLLDDAPVAIGTDIWPHGRWRVDFRGCADHAGTTALPDRDDALLKAADFIGCVRAEAQAGDGRDGRLVATVGKLAVVPGGINAIASATTAWLDARGESEVAVTELVSRLDRAAAELDGTMHQESWTPTTRFDTSLVDRLQTTLPDAPQLGTGAGHDAGILANHGTPTAMLFVRNPTGVSHSPAEHAEREDCLAGVEALTTVLADLADAPGSGADSEARA